MPSRSTVDGWALTAFVAAMGLSALLVFSVQPMLAKMLLPRFGGSPSVWAVSMCFFQGALLAGYGYAHALTRTFKGPRAVWVHAAAVLLAASTLPFGLRAAASATVATNPYSGLFGALAATAGPAFLVLAASAPLLQAWFSRSGHPRAADPYFLYAASNIGSLAGLLAYPILLEPQLALGAQTRLWTAGYVVLGLLIAGCGVWALGGGDRAAAAPQASPPADEAPVTRADRLWWIALALVPSGLLVAFTTFLASDIASAPFLWVMPLALYLLTFILAFRPAPLPGERWLRRAHPILATAAIIDQAMLGAFDTWFNALLALLGFLVSCLVAHRTLYERRPTAGHLTEYYLWLSFGGALGGLFASLLAPRLFATDLEFPLLLATGVAVLPSLWRPAITTGERRGLLAVGVLAIVAFAALFAVRRVAATEELQLIGLAALLPVTLLTPRWPRPQLAVVVLATALVTWQLLAGQTQYLARSFFGVHRVREHGDFRLLFHGTTVHGTQRVRSPDGAPVDPAQPPAPGSYYHATGSLALGLDLARHAIAAERRPATVAIVGLGAGAMACHVREGERWRFFEIDAVVVDIARHSGLFGYLPRCQPDAAVVLGDARLTLAAEPAAAFDYLLIDAFSSDSVPVHLITVEALRLYLSKLSERGVLALHISNRNVELASVVAANAAAIGGLATLLAEPRKLSPDADFTRAVLIARHEDILAPARQYPGAARLAGADTRAWTDDFSNVLAGVVRMQRDRFRTADERAIVSAGAIIRAYPDDPAAYASRARALLARDESRAAIGDLSRLIELAGPNPGVFKARGLAYQRLGEDDKAIADLTAALDSLDRDLDLLAARGVAYANRGRRQEAAEDFRRILFLNPDNARVRDLLQRLGEVP